VRVKDINPTGDSDDRFRVAGHRLLQRHDGTGAELWQATAARPARRVADINPTGGSYPAAFLNAGGTRHFRADDGTTGVGLWKSDGGRRHRARRRHQSERQLGSGEPPRRETARLHRRRRRARRRLWSTTGRRTGR
jgi:hypothetical protein